MSKTPAMPKTTPETQPPKAAISPKLRAVLDELKPTKAERLTAKQLQKKMIPVLRRAKAEGVELTRAEERILARHEAEKPTPE